MIDNRTERLDLPLPDIDNYLEDDVPRLKEALNKIDQKVVILDDGGKIQQSDLPTVVPLLNTQGKLPPDTIPSPSEFGAEAEGAADEAVEGHEAKAGAHSISGVTGLQDALDSKEASGTASSLVTPLAARVTALEARKSTCLVNASGTGAPHETVSANLPANIAINTRYVLANPFGVNVPVECVAEIYANGRWAKTGWMYASGGYGVLASYLQGEGIVIQTGGVALLPAAPRDIGSAHAQTANVFSAPCRVSIRRIDD